MYSVCIRTQKLQPEQLMSLCYFFWSALSWMWIVMFLFPSLCFSLIWWCTEKKKKGMISTWNVVICLNIFEMFRRYFVWCCHALKPQCFLDTLKMNENSTYILRILLLIFPYLIIIKIYLLYPVDVILCNNSLFE